MSSIDFRFEDAHRKYQQRLYAHVREQLNHVVPARPGDFEERVEDIVVETWVAAYRRQPDSKTEAELVSLVFSIVDRICGD